MTEQDRSATTKSPGAKRRWFHVDRRCAWLSLVSLLVLIPASWWGVPHAVDSTTVRGWDVDGIAGIGVLSELNNLLFAHRADWYVAYPLFHYIVLTVVYAPYLAFLLLTGHLSHPNGVYPFGFQHPVAAIAMLSFLARAVTLIMAAGSVVLAYLTGTTLWDRRAGTLTAFVLLLTMPFAYYARTSNLDMPVLFWKVAAFYACVRVIKLGLTRRRALAVGIVSALAVATKDQAYAVLVPVLLYTMFVAYRDRTQSADATDSTGTRPTWRNLTVLIVSGIVAFAIAGGIVFSPGRFIHHVEFITHFQENFSNIRYPTVLTVMRPRSLGGNLLLLGDCVTAITRAVGIPAAIAGLVGLIMLLATGRQRRSGIMLALALLGFFVLTLVPIRHMQFRYTLFPAFAVALCAGALWTRMLSGQQSVRALGVVWIVAALAMAAWSELDLTWQMLRDARYAAGDWLASATVPGDSVAYFGKQHQLPYFPPGVVPVEFEADPNAENRLCAGTIKFLLVSSGYFATPTREHSIFLPDTTYAKLTGGRLGYHRVFVSTTPGLGRGPLPYFPYVNPKVQIFALNKGGGCVRDTVASVAPSPEQVALQRQPSSLAN